VENATVADVAPAATLVVVTSLASTEKLLGTLGAVVPCALETEKFVVAPESRSATGVPLIDSWSPVMLKSPS
jgi:hypothetical protein